MTRFLQFFNLFGIVALMALCVVQWQTNRDVNLRANALEKVQLDQAAALEEKEKAIKACTADLDSFRDQLAQSDKALKEAETMLTAFSSASTEVTAEREKIKATATEWTTGITARDEQLKKANEEIQKLAAERNDAVEKYNALVTKHNEVVKDLNEARAKLAKGKNG